MALARATISGILIGDPEKRFTPNNIGVTNFDVQVPAGAGRNDAAFVVRVTCWRNLADTAAERLQKGSAVVVEGRLQINQFETNGAVPKRSYEIDATNLYLGELETLTPAFEGNTAGGNARQQQPQQQQQQQYAPQSSGYATPPATQYGGGGGAGNQMPDNGGYQPVAAGIVAPPAQPFPPDDILTDDDIPF